MSDERGVRLLDRIPVLALACMAIGCAIVMALMVAPFVPALVWSLTLAIMLTPVEKRLKALTRSSTLAVIITLVLAAGLVVLPAVIVTGALANEVMSGAAALANTLSPEHLTALRSDYPQLAGASDQLVQWIEFSRLREAAAGLLTGWSARLAQGSLAFLAILALTFYFLFYLLRDAAVLRSGLQRFLPLTPPEFSALASRVEDTVFASVYATAGVSILQGVLGGAMFWILGLPSPVFWGVIMGLLAIVPFLGAFIVWVPAAAGLALQGHWIAAIMLTAWGTLVVGLIDNIIYPILVGQRLRLHSMVSFMAIVGGLLLFGAHGIVLGPLIVAIAQGLHTILRNRLEPGVGVVPPSER